MQKPVSSAQVLGGHTHPFTQTAVQTIPFGLHGIGPHALAQSLGT